MVDTNNAYSLPEDMQAARKADVKLYLDSRTQIPNYSPAIVKVILEWVEYKKRKLLIVKKKQETRAEWYNAIKTQKKKLSPWNIEHLPETEQSKKRTDMLDYAQKNDTDNAERIALWLWRVQELRTNGAISDTAEWVQITWVWVLASTATHNKVLEENFLWNVQDAFDWNNHSWNKSELNTVRKGDLDKKLKENDWVLSWNYKLESTEFLTWTIFSWIDENFEWVKDQEDKLYLLQLINPDMFTRLYFNSTNTHSSWHSRQAVKLSLFVYNRTFYEYYAGHDRCGLFLVWKC